MKHKHNDDTLKTMGEIIKGENENTPATPQPKKQCCLDCKYHGYSNKTNTHLCHYYCNTIDIWDLETIYNLKCPGFKSQ